MLAVAAGVKSQSRRSPAALTNRRADSADDAGDPDAAGEADGAAKTGGRNSHIALESRFCCVEFVNRTAWTPSIVPTSSDGRTVFLVANR